MTTTSWWWRVGGAGVGLLAAVGLRGGSLIPWRDRSADAAHVRLSWSARPERVEHCRRLRDDELAQLPAHMRLRVQCDGVLARYLLAVRVDDTVVASDTLRGGGLRHDRPIHVYREVTVPPGPRRIRIDVTRLDSALTTGGDSPTATESDTLLGSRASREADERSRRAKEAMPARLAVDTSLQLLAGNVVLVIYDEPNRRLDVVSQPRRAQSQPR